MKKIPPTYMSAIPTMKSRGKRSEPHNEIELIMGRVIRSELAITFATFFLLEENLNTRTTIRINSPIITRILLFPKGSRDIFQYSLKIKDIISIAKRNTR